jgi:hypothetical protein
MENYIEDLDFKEKTVVATHTDTDIRDGERFLAVRKYKSNKDGSLWYKLKDANWCSCLKPIEWFGDTEDDSPLTFKMWE